MKLTKSEEITCAKAVLFLDKFCNDRKGSCAGCFLNNLNYCPYSDPLDGAERLKQAIQETEAPEPEKPFDPCHGNTDCSNCTMELCPFR